MESICPSCSGTTVFIDFSQSNPTYRCVNCAWDVLLDENRCTQPVQGWGGYGAGARCKGTAVVGGRCWRHLKDHVLHREIYDYFRSHAQYDDLPRLHHTVFVEALKNASIVIMDERHGERLRKQAVAARVKPERSASVVYFVEREGLIKIGTTTNLEKRLKALSKGSCMPPGMTVGPVELLATEPGDSLTEGALHGRFAKTRVGNTEWFRPSRALRNYIDDLRRYQEHKRHFMRRVGAA